jgi:hypothetical protein
MTYYQVFVGPDTPFVPLKRLPVPQPGIAAVPHGGPRIPATIADGTSNTFLIVEAGWIRRERGATGGEERRMGIR